MFINTDSDYVKCNFGVGYETSSGLSSGKLDVFFSETKDLGSRFSEIKNFITSDEQLRADKFHFDNNREIFVICHAMLRLVLARCLNINPLDISYKNGINKKPYLLGNSIHFNLSHTQDAFAFAVSRDFYVGIDLEEIDQRIDIHSIVKSYFSKKEREYILKSEVDAKNRFFLLWTRKEALLKAFGTGIMDDLSQIEVSDKENSLNRKLFNNLSFDYGISNMFLYSGKILKYYLSIATPYKASINFYHLDPDSILSYLE